jgi:1-phosphofructokinase
MVYTLTFSPSIDYVMEIKQLTPGEMNRAQATHIYPGGKGINVSAVLHSMGVENIILGFIAGFTGNEIENILNRHGHKTDFIRLKNGLSRINVKVLASESTELNAPAPAIRKDDLKQLNDRLQALKEGDTLVISGSVPSGLPDYTYRVILDSMKDRNITTVVDTTGPLLLSALESHPFLIKPNREELGELFSTKNISLNDAEKYAHTLQDKGARNVLISLDREGAMLLCEDGTLLTREAPRGNVVNPVGAGDAMLAGFIYGWLETGTYEDALKTAVCAGSASAFSSGLPSKDDIMSLRRLMKD